MFSKLHLFNQLAQKSSEFCKNPNVAMPNPGAQQFRYAQTPSKVLHFRNLPWECTDEELIELCKPFGAVVNTKCNVGSNGNQAFVEFVDINQAINMASYYASSSDPAKIRGKSVYIQYSNRQEVVNHKGPGDIPGNVLLVTMGGVEPNDISIEVIHLVFSAFGFVQKIATFEKAAGFQALIQYTDAETAYTAKESLDGRSIPRYLLPEHVKDCLLRISYSAHTDLTIKFQSNRSRDYTNAYLPVNSTLMGGYVQPVVGPNVPIVAPQSNVLLATFGNMQYAVTVDVLHTVFSTYGAVQKIAIFDKNVGTQAFIQYPDVTTATIAKNALQGHCIYDGGYCKLHLTYSHHTDLNVKDSDRTRDYTVSFSGLPATTATTTTATAWQNPNVYPWDPAMQQQQVETSSFMPGPTIMPGGGHPYLLASAYPTDVTPTTSSPRANLAVQNNPVEVATAVPGAVFPPGL